MKNSIINILLVTFLLGCATEKQSSTKECINFDELEIVNDHFLHRKTAYNGCAQENRGKNTIELQFVNGKKNGYVKQFKNNVLIEEGNFKDNLLDGIFKTFYPDGSIESTVVYKNGFKEGVKKIYWETGELGHTYHYSKDKLVDTSYSYYRNGNKLARSIQLDGFGNSEEINYLDSTRTTFMSGSMRNGYSIGDWIFKFSPDSCLIRHYGMNNSYTQTKCDCNKIIVPKI